MATIKLMLNKSRVLTNGTYPIVIQIIQLRRKKLIYTGYRINEKQFDEKKCLVVYRTDFPITRYGVGKINKAITKQFRKIKEIIAVLNAESTDYSVSKIIGRYQLSLEDTCLFNFLDKRILVKRELGRIGIVSAYQSTRSSLEKYWGCEDAKISDITPQFVSGYEQFLLRNGVTTNTAAYYLRNLRTIYNYAIEMGCETTSINPFRNVTTNPCKTVKRALSRQKLLQMAMADFSNRPTVEIARDAFLFSFYTRGMSMVDIINLTHANITDGVLTYTRHKTGQVLSVLLTDRLKELLDKYKNDSPYLFPFMHGETPEQKYQAYRLALRRINNGLKIVAKELKMETNLTTYVARHSWATQAKEHGASLAVISEGLGHTSEKTTAIYLKQFDRSVIDRINEVVTDLK